MKILNDNNININIVEYLKEGLSRAEIKNIAKSLNLKPKDFIRKSEKEFKNLNLSSKDLENDDIVEKAIINHPKILQRPIIIKNEKAMIGRPPEKILDFL